MQILFHIAEDADALLTARYIIVVLPANQEHRPLTFNRSLPFFRRAVSSTQHRIAGQSTRMKTYAMWHGFACSSHVVASCCTAEAIEMPRSAAMQGDGEAPNTDHVLPDLEPQAVSMVLRMGETLYIR